MLKRLIAALAAASMVGVMASAAFAESNDAEESTAQETVLAEDEAVEAESEAAEETENTGEVLELSLAEAIATALDANPQMLAADAAIESAELSYDVMAINTRDIQKLEKNYTISIDITDDDSMAMAYLKEGYYLYASEIGIELQNMAKEQVEAQISYDVTEKYFNLKLLEKLISISETSLSLAEENADIVKKQFELGLVSDLEVQNVNASVESAEFSLESYKRSKEIALESFKITAQLEDETREIVLTDDLVLPDMPEGVDEAAQAALSTRYDAVSLLRNYEMQEKYFEVTKYYIPDSVATYYSAYSDYMTAKYNYEANTKLIALSIKQEYNEILSASEAIQSAESALNVKQTEYDSACIKYEMGLITNLEKTEIMAELDSCKVQLENAHLTYMLAVQKYNYDIGIGL